MQHSYVQIAVCGPSRSSMLTGRRPDSTHVGTGKGGWCWCQRTNCTADELFMTIPTYFRKNGYVTAGNGKLFHPDACSQYSNGAGHFSHSSGDDPRAWSYGRYGVEANVSQEQWGSIPGPHDPVFNKTMGVDRAWRACSLLSLGRRSPTQCVHLAVAQGSRSSSPH